MAKIGILGCLYKDCTRIRFDRAEKGEGIKVFFSAPGL